MGPGGGSTGEMRPTSRTRTRCASGGSMDAHDLARAPASEADSARLWTAAGPGTCRRRCARRDRGRRNISFKRIDARSGADSLAGGHPRPGTGCDPGSRRPSRVLPPPQRAWPFRGPSRNDGSGETVTVAAPRAPAARADGIVLAAAIQPTATIAVSSDERTLVIGDCFMSCTARVVDLASGGERAINGLDPTSTVTGWTQTGVWLGEQCLDPSTGVVANRPCPVSRRSSSMSTSDSDSRCRAGGASRCSAFRARTRCRSCSVRSRSRRTAPRQSSTASASSPVTAEVGLARPTAYNRSANSLHEDL